MTALLAFAAALAFAQADAPDAPDPQPMDGVWRAISIDDEGPSGRAVAFIEPGTMLRQGDDIRFRLDVRLEHASSGADSIVTIVHADCAARRYEMLSVASYRARRLMGSFGAMPMTQAEPGTNIGGVLERACTGQYLSEPVDREQYVRAYFGAAPAPAQPK
jgi:hypothetical protein